MRFASASQTEGRGLKNRAPVRGGRNSTTNVHLGKDGNVCLFLLSFLIMFFFSLLHPINPAYFSHCISSFFSSLMPFHEMSRPFSPSAKYQLPLLGSLNILGLPHSCACECDQTGLLSAWPPLSNLLQG